MKKNVNTVDAMLRITIGLTGLAWGTAQMVRQPKRSTPMIVTMLSAMKVAEGITRFCPMLAMFKTSSNQLMETTQEAGQQVAQTANKVAQSANKVNTNELMHTMLSQIGEHRSQQSAKQEQNRSNDYQH